MGGEGLEPPPSGDTHEKDEVIIKIGDTGIKNSEYEKLLGIKVDTKLNFNDHSNDIIIKARCKVNALSRIMPYVNSYKKKKTTEFIFNSQFSYFPLFCMLHSRIINNKIITCMRGAGVYYTVNKSSSFEKLSLEQDTFVMMHARNLQVLAKEVYQLYRNMSPLTYSEVFHRRGINYNLPINSEFALPNVRSAFHGSESISYFKPKNCSYRLCNTFSI